MLLKWDVVKSIIKFLDLLFPQRYENIAKCQSIFLTFNFLQCLKHFPTGFPEKYYESFTLLLKY